MTRLSGGYNHSVDRSSHPATPAPGWLLVAAPSLEDPNFHRTVVVMLAFTPEDGALGLVVNRPNELPVETVLPGWADAAAPPDSLFVGGPVARDSLICLAQLKPEYVSGFDGCSPVADGRLAAVDLNRQPFEVTAGIDRLRIFSGYAGWQAGQLEDELDAGGWLVLPAVDDDVFSTEPEHLWRHVLRRQGGHTAMYANAPPKLSMN
jgi:putative transcriptional regulator